MSDHNARRLLGGLSIHVKAVRGLKKVVSFGIQDPYVQIGLNNEKKDTKQIMDGGSDCVFDEILRFNIDADPSDLLYLKVKHKSTFSKTTIGVFSLSLRDLLKMQARSVKFQLVDEEDFTPTGMIEIVPEYHGQNEPPMPAKTIPHAASASAATTPAAAALAPPQATTPQAYGSSPQQNQRSVSPQPITPIPGVPLVAPIPLAAIEPLPSPPPTTIAASAPPMPQQQQQPPPFSSQPPPQFQQPPQQPQPYMSQPPAQQQGYQPPPPVVQPQQGGYQPPPPVLQGPVVANSQYNSFASAPYGSQAPQQSHPPQFGAPPQVQYQKPIMYQSQQPVSYQPPMPTFQPAFGSQQPPPPYQQQPQPQQFMSQAPVQQPQQAQMSIAPFQTLAVGRPHIDSRMFDDMQYLGIRASSGRIVEVRVFATVGNVRGIQLVYSINGQRLDGPVAGATVPNGPTVMYINDAQGERIEAILGRISAQELESLTIKTNRQVLKWSNSMEGQEFQLNIPAGHRVVGFHGSFSQNGLTSLGAYSTPF